MESIAKLYKIGYGPSSSHTMGPQKAVEHFLKIYQQTAQLQVILYGSLALTGQGHLTDYIIRKTAGSIPVTFVWKKLTYIEEHPNTMDIIGSDHTGVEIGRQRVYSVGGGDIRYAVQASDESTFVYPHKRFDDIAKYCCTNNKTLLEYIDYFDPYLDTYLLQVWHAMQHSIQRGVTTKGVLRGTLALQRKAPLLLAYDLMRLEAYAYAVNEENANASGLIVTAPTCGACGTLPAVLQYEQDLHHFSDHEIIAALKISGLIGTIIKTSATISGAVGGCQAEVGTATSMAAAAIAQLHHQDITVIESAAEIAMEHQLGLTCDPVEGYVQIPCIQRNAIAAKKAYTAYELASVLGMTETVSFDTVVEVMYETGKDLPYAYRETSKGGLARYYHNKKMIGPMC